MRLQMTVRSSLFCLAVFAGCIPECGQKQMRAEADVKALELSIRSYVTRTGHLPNDLEDIAPPHCDGGDCIIEVISLDPWGRPYGLRPGAVGAKRVCSSGRDIESSDDDVCSEDIGSSPSR